MKYLWNVVSLIDSVMTEHKLKHLELIQGVVNRLASNSFQLKGWCVTLVTGILFFGSTMAGEKRHLLMIALIPVLIFWMLDGYFLWQERLFRRTYDIVRQKPEAGIDFKMFEKGDKRLYWIKAVFSLTLIAFYIGLISAIVLLRVCVFSSS
ncbi:MAG: hypothetical protein Roseis2KO_41810 [Roseivirga sp.]